MQGLFRKDKDPAATGDSLRTVSFRWACVERQAMESVSHVFREEGIQIVADTIAEAVADKAYSIESGD